RTLHLHTGVDSVRPVGGNRRQSAARLDALPPLPPVAALAAYISLYTYAPTAPATAYSTSATTVPTVYIFCGNSPIGASPSPPTTTRPQLILPIAHLVRGTPLHYGTMSTATIPPSPSGTVATPLGTTQSDPSTSRLK